MYEFVPQDDEAILDICVTQFGLPRVPEGCTVIAYRKVGEYPVEVAALFERWTGPGGSVTAHWAAPGGKTTRRMLFAVFHYVFGQLKVEKMIGEVRASDKKVRELDERLGMKPVATIAGYFPDDDLVIYEMRREDCLFLPKEVKDGKT